MNAENEVPRSTCAEEPVLGVTRPVSRPDGGDAVRSDGWIVERLRDSKLFRGYQVAFEAATGLPLSLRKPGSFQPPLQGSKVINAFCALMAGQNQSCAACLQLQERVESEARDATNTLECYAGLNESLVPIRVGKRLIAHLQTGQVLFRRPSSTRFERLLRQMADWGLKVDAKMLSDAYFKTRVVSRPQYEGILGLLASFAEHFSGLINQIMVTQAAAEAPTMTRARGFIFEHQAEEIGLLQVARAVNMSAYYFCKVFKRSTGFTFTDYLARVRVESAKHILLNPHKRVSEAAYEAGFQSLSQFNRVFRRVAGEAPSDYRPALIALR